MINGRIEIEMHIRYRAYTIERRLKIGESSLKRANRLTPSFCCSLSECYFAGKGAALVLPPNERARPSRRVSAAGCDIQQHLQSMFYLLRPEETLKMVSYSSKNKLPLKFVFFSSTLSSVYS